MINFDTPILILIYNRPKITVELFKKLKKIKPNKIYIHADGPKNEEDLEKCNLTRQVFSKINWNCTVKKNLEKRI